MRDAGDGEARIVPRNGSHQKWARRSLTKKINNKRGPERRSLSAERRGGAAHHKKLPQRAGPSAPVNAGGFCRAREGCRGAAFAVAQRMRKRPEGQTLSC